MVTKKVLSVFVLTALALVISINTISAPNNISITSFTNNTIVATTNSSGISINFSIVAANYSDLVGGNISLNVDSNHTDICSILASGDNDAPYITDGIDANATGQRPCNGTTIFAGGNYSIMLPFNLSEGVHRVAINLTNGVNNMTTKNGTTTGGGVNHTFIVLNYDSLAFATGTYGDYSNLSATVLDVNVTFNTHMWTNVTYTLFNHTGGQVMYHFNSTGHNVSFGVWDLTGRINNFSGANYTFTGLPNMWYTVNISIVGNVTTVGYNKTITRHFILDTVAPNATVTCPTGWKEENAAGGVGTVLKDATLSCECSATDDNETSVAWSAYSYTYDPSSTPTTAENGLKGVTCTAIDKAGNNGTSDNLNYLVIEEGGDPPGGGSTPSGTTYKVTEEQFDEGMTSKLAANDQFEITFSPSSKTAAESHTVTVSSVGTDSVIVVIASDPIEVKVMLGEEKKVDIDGDGIYDLLVKLNSIEDGKADLVVQATEGEFPEGEGAVSGGTGLEEEEPTGMSMWIWIIAILVIIIIAAVVMASKKKK